MGHKRPFTYTPRRENCKQNKDLHRRKLSNTNGELVGAKSHSTQNIKRRPGGYGGWVGQKFKPAASGADGTTTIDNQQIAETHVRAVTAGGESYLISEDGCLVPGSVV